MKIAIPVSETNKHYQVDKNFGRASHFLIFDSETEHKEIIENECADLQSGVGIKAAQAIIDSGSTVLITPRCGGKARKALDAANIALYKTNGEDIDKNINLFLDNKLAALSD